MTNASVPSRYERFTRRSSLALAALRRFLLRLWLWTIAIGTLLLTIAHVLKPTDYAMDGPTVAVLALLLFVPSLHLIRRIKIFEFEADIGSEETRDVTQPVEERLEEIPPAAPAADNPPAAPQAESPGVPAAAPVLPPPRAPGHLADPERSVERTRNWSNRGQYLELLALDPALALAKARIDLEAKLRDHLIKTTGQAPAYSSITRLVDALEKSGNLPRGLAADLRPMVNLMNRAVHGASIEREAAFDLVMAVQRVLEYLDTKERRAPLAPPTTLTP